MRKFVGLVVCSALLTGCSSGEDSRRERSIESGTADENSADGATGCEAYPPVRNVELCGTVDVGEQILRYAIVPAAREVRSAILIDPGGPGEATLTAGDLLPLTQTLGDGHNLVLIEEPWVTSPPLTDECRTALRAQYAEHAGERPRAASSVEDTISQCRLGAISYGFAAGDYAEAVIQIAAQSGLDFVGFAGASFAAVRRSYLPDDFGWTAIARPYPVGVSGAELLEARAVAADAVAIAGDVSQMYPAVVGSATLAFARAGAPGRLNSDSIERLAGVTWELYGDGEISPSMLAYWDEACAVLGRESAELRGTTPATMALIDLHQPCRHVSEDDTPDLSAGWIPQSCVTAGAEDAVTPAPLIRSAFEAGTIVESAVAAHNSLDGLQECIQRFLPSPS